MREKLIKLIGATHYGNNSLVGENFQEGFIAKIADNLIANGVTFATDNNVGDKRTPTDDEMSANTEIFDVYIPCRTCGKLIPAGGDNHCLTCRVWQLRLEETMPKWISVKDRLPENFVSVLGYMTDAGDFPPVRECYTVGNAFFFPALGDVHPVSHWCEMPKPPKGE